MTTILIWIWLAGWIGATIFAAAFIGNLDNARKGDEMFPAFFVPLFFGWTWPALLALGLMVAPLGWLSDRATARAKIRTAVETGAVGTDERSEGVNQ
jgi:hypothetical protein